MFLCAETSGEKGTWEIANRFPQRTGISWGTRHDGREGGFLFRSFFLMLCTFLPFLFLVISFYVICCFSFLKPNTFKIILNGKTSELHSGPPNCLIVCPVAYASTFKSRLWISSLPAFIQGVLSARNTHSGPVSLGRFLYSCHYPALLGILHWEKLGRGRQSFFLFPPQAGS